MPVSFTHLYIAEPTVSARRLLWHVLSVGSVSRDESEHHQGHDKAGAHLFWVVSGKGQLQVGARRIPLRKDLCCWLVDLTQERRYLPDAGETLVTAGFRFSGPGIEAWREALGNGRRFDLSAHGDFAGVKRAQRTLLKLVRARPSCYEWTCHQTVTDVLGRLLRAGEVLSASIQPTPEPVTRVIRTVLADPAQDWKAQELAEIAHVSYSGLRALFKASQQESVHEFLQRTRLDQARLLLGDPNLSIKDVTRRLNFSSEAYFSHFFHKATGISPSTFRRNQHE